MVKQFLLDYEQELLEKKIDLMKSLQKNELSKKENMEFIHFIEKSEDKSYDSFSPQNYSTRSDRKRLKELKEEKQRIEELSTKVETEIKDIDSKLEKLYKVLDEIRKYDIVEEEKGSAIDYPGLNSIVHKIEFCSNLVDVDPKRCKLELMEICREMLLFTADLE